MSFATIIDRVKSWKIPRLPAEKKKRVLLIAGGVAGAALITGGILWVVLGRDPDAYQQLQNALKKTEALGGYEASVQATYQATYNGAMDEMKMAGLLYVKKKPSKTMLVTQAEATYQNYPDNNYQLTTSLFSDGKAVYEKDGVTARAADISQEEFQEICEKNALLRFARRDVASVQETAGNEAGGTTCLVFQLSTVDKDLLESHAEQYETMIPGEVDVAITDIKLTQAQAVYILRDGYVLSQNLQMGTSYEKDGLTMTYQSLTEVGFVDISEGFDFTLPDIPD